MQERDFHIWQYLKADQLLFREKMHFLVFPFPKGFECIKDEIRYHISLH